MKVVLINPYELGRQPFGLAHPAAWLEADGFSVHCIDLSLQKLSADALQDAALIAVHLPMHTATRIALQAQPSLQRLAPQAHYCAYGLYGPPNDSLLRERGFHTVLGGEFEPALVDTARAIRNGLWEPAMDTKPRVHLQKIEFMPPARGGLPDISQYASLVMPDGSTKTVGFVEGSRGCKHLCRHCPVVPVYQGKFRIVPTNVVLADIRAQVAAGAEHISFGDPDFLNGPTHARRLVRALHEAFPKLTYDCTVKVEHLIAHRDIAVELVQTGCSFVTTAVEAIEDDILERLDKGHTAAQFEQAVAMAAEIQLNLAPTFVPFTPWTSLDGYVRLLEKLVELNLTEAVPAIQLAIRLLVPAGSRLLELAEFSDLAGPFDPALLGYAWHHPDPRVDRLQRKVEALAAEAETRRWSRAEAFRRIYRAACEAAGKDPLPLDPSGRPIAHHSEPWYCCAEPTTTQLQSF